MNPLEGVIPSEAYAAWSSDQDERRTSASGGIATEIYKYALNNGWSIVGAAFCEDFKVHLELSSNWEAIKSLKILSMCLVLWLMYFMKYIRN